MESGTSKWAVGVFLFAEFFSPLWLSAQNTRYKLIDISTLGGPSAHGPGNGPGGQLINNSGQVAGTADTSAGCCHGFRWQGGVLTDLGTLPGGNGSDTSAINARGWISGGSGTSAVDPLTGSSTEHAVLWKEDNQIVDLGTLPGGVESATLYVKNGGEVVGVATVDTVLDPFASIGQGPYPSPTHAFIWKNGVMRDLGTLGGPDSFALGGCNNDRTGLVTGSSFTTSTPNLNSGFPTLDPFLWENGTMTDLGSLGGTFGFAECANNSGQVIGQSNLTGDSEQHAFFWDHGTLSDLGTLGGTFSMAMWLNNAGEAVGGATTANDESFHAFLWRNGVIGDLGTLPGDCASVALAINSRSQIVGQSFNCDTNISETVLWDNGSIIDLHIASNDALNINDRGEITGVYLPPGCDNTDLCSHAFVLVPCNDAGVQGCDNAEFIVQPSPAAIATRAAITRVNTQKAKGYLAHLRVQLAQRHHIPGLGAPKN
jgi:probable HAF family extracellular repeat protein